MPDLKETSLLLNSSSIDSIITLFFFWRSYSVSNYWLGGPSISFSSERASFFLLTMVHVSTLSDWDYLVFSDLLDFALSFIELKALMTFLAPNLTKKFEVENL